MPFDLSQIFAGIGAQVSQSRQRSSNPMVEHYAQRITSLLSHAARWAMVGSSGAQCSIYAQGPKGVLRCGSTAISACVVCRQMVCFDHAMISVADGNTICFGCVHRAQVEIGPKSDQRSQPRDPGGPSWPDEGWPGGKPPPTKSEIREQHLDQLGLQDPVEDQEIKKAYRDLASKFHPDKARSNSTRNRYERKMRKINQSYEWLIKRKEAA